MEISSRYWERVRGFISENRVDARWVLRQHDEEGAFGSLRIVSHPDLKPGYLRSVWTVVTSRKPKSDEEIQQSVKDFQMDEIELEVYSVNDKIETVEKTYEAPMQELEQIYGVKIFE